MLPWERLNLNIWVRTKTQEIKKTILFIGLWFFHKYWSFHGYNNILHIIIAYSVNI